MECLDENAVAELFDGALDEAARVEVEAHLDTCAACRSVVSALASELSSAHGPSPPLVDTDDATGELHAGDVVGRYAVLECVGVGSMGIVYAAYDPDLDRRIALKVLRARTSEDDRDAALREAKSMARLSHPNIVAVHDVGAAPDGRIFIAMEYVEGSTLSAWTRAEDRAWREVLAVYLAAGRGLVAAHDAGVVHRDFKPDNVLVGDDGRVRVTDFGLAAVQTIVTGDAAEPNVTGIVGTPRYMAPEQHRAELATGASDQFSFCVALFEALYGEPPFEGDTAFALERAATAGAIRPTPSGSAIPVAVRRALARGLSAEPEDRHDTMAELVDRLEAATRRPRLRRVALAAVGLGAIGVVGAVASADPPCPPVALDDVWNDDARVAISTAIEGTRAPYAEDTKAGTAEVLDAYAEAWTDVHRDICEATELRRTQTRSLLAVRMACLERRREEFAALVDVLATTNAGTVDQAVDAAARLTPAVSCLDLGPSSRPAPPAALVSQLARAKALADAGDFDAAIREGGAVVTESGFTADGEPPEGKTRSRDPATAAEALLIVAWAQSHAASEQAEQTLHRALQLAESTGADELRARAMTLLVFVVGYAQARYGEGLRWGALSRSLAERVPPTAAEHAQLLRYLGLLHHEQGHFEIGEGFQRRALERLRDADLAAHPEYAKVLRALADAVMAQKRVDEAEPLFREALERATTSLGPWHPRVANAAHGLGNALERQGRTEDARAQYERALEIHTAIHGRQHNDVAGDLLALGLLALDENDLRRAEAALQEALSIQDALGRGDHPRRALTLEAVARLRDDQGRHGEAVDLMQQAVAMEERVRPDHPSVATAQYNLGRMLLESDRPEDAVEPFMAAERLATAALGPDHQLVALSLGSLGTARVRAGDPAAAIDSLERALELAANAAIGPLAHFEIRLDLARALRQTGREPARALALARLAQHEYEASPHPDPERLAEAESFLSR